MARESCNLDKEEAEIFKPPSPSSSSTSSPTPMAAAPPPLFLKPHQEPPGPRRGTPASDPAVAASSEQEERAEEEEFPPQARSASRCSSCRRRVGLTGFRCRCGDLFCSRHRHSDTHDCSFDYKAAGREEISKANPLIRAAKIIKI